MPLPALSSTTLRCLRRLGWGADLAAPQPLSSVPVLERLPSVGECGVGDICSLAPVLAAAWRRAGAFRRGAALPVGVVDRSGDPSRDRVFCGLPLSRREFEVVRRLPREADAAAWRSLRVAAGVVAVGVDLLWQRRPRPLRRGQRPPPGPGGRPLGGGWRPRPLFRPGGGPLRG